MSSCFRSGPVFLCLVLCACFLPVSAAASSWAKVGESVIDSSQVELEFQRMLPMSVGFHGKISQDKIDEIRDDAEKEVIERAYKASYARRMGLLVDEKEVLDAYRIYLSKLSQGQIDKLLNAYGRENLLASVRLRLNAEKAEETAVESRVQVTSQEIADYYEEKRSSFLRPPLYRASHILLKVDPAAPPAEKESILQKAQALVGKARAGEDFYNLAYYNSDDRTRYVGGDLGRFHQGQTVREFDEALAELEVGEVSEPVRTRYGYHIIRLTEKQPATQLELEEAAPLIRKTLEKRRRDALYESWMKQLAEEFPLEMTGK